MKICGCDLWPVWRCGRFSEEEEHRNQPTNPTHRHASREKNPSLSKTRSERASRSASSAIWRAPKNSTHREN